MVLRGGAAAVAFIRVRRLTRQRNHLPASAADGKMRKHLAALPLPQAPARQMRSGSPHRDENRVGLSQFMAPPVPGTLPFANFAAVFSGSRPSRVDRRRAPLPRPRRLKPATLQILQNLLADFLRRARRSLAAHRGFVHAKHAPISSSLPVKIIRGQQDTAPRHPDYLPPLQSPAPAAKARAPASVAQGRAPARRILQGAPRGACVDSDPRGAAQA